MLMPPKYSRTPFALFGRMATAVVIAFGLIADADGGKEWRLRARERF
jgi:hypothetical protein